LFELLFFELSKPSPVKVLLEGLARCIKGFVKDSNSKVNFAEELLQGFSAQL